MKVFFKKNVTGIFCELTFYSSLNPIPFNLKLNNSDILPETIYTRNLSGENFIELRFDKNTQKLYEISLVAIQNDTIRLSECKFYENIDFFDCYIDEDSELEISNPIQILRSDNALSIVWGNKSLFNFGISENCILGVDENNYLCTITLINLNNKTIYNILGT